MRFDWVNILATVIFVSIVVTLILAVASYFAYKVREARRPKTAAELRQEGQVKVFFSEYKPGETAAWPTSTPKAERFRTGPRARGRARLKKKHERARRRVVAGARVVAMEAAEVARSIAAAEAPPETVAAVQEAAAAMQEAASVVALTWPEVERRSKPRLAAFHLHNARVQWKHVAIYAPPLLPALLLGVFALWSFFQRQSLVLDAIPLPKVTVVTANPASRLAASWVRLLNDAELQSTLVTADKVETLEGVIVLCDIWSLPQPLAANLDRFLANAGSGGVIGAPPVPPLGGLHLTADSGVSDTAVKVGESASPLLARLAPGAVVWLQPAKVAFLKETPRMAIDARWRTNARAAVIHVENGRARYVWIGIDADALPPAGNNDLALLVRNAFRWAGGEAVGGGGVGAAAGAERVGAPAGGAGG